MALRALALHLPDAALARLAVAFSPGAASATAYILEGCGSEAVIAALRASTSSAARRAAAYAVARGPKSVYIEFTGSGYEVSAMEDARLFSTTAAADRFSCSPPTAASSPTPTSSPSPVSGSHVVALLATDWARSALGASSGLGPYSIPAPALGALPTTSSSSFLVPVATAASSDRYSLPANSTNGLFLATASSHAAPTLHARPRTSIIIPRAGPARFHTSAAFDDSPSDEAQDVDYLIMKMNGLKPGSPETQRFRVAYHKKFFPYWEASDFADYIKHKQYTYNEWVCILKVIYKNVGPMKEAMDLHIEKDLETDDKEMSKDPALAKLDKKLDLVLKVQKTHGDALDKLTESSDPKKKKSEWGSFKLFGRKFDLTKVITIGDIFL